MDIAKYFYLGVEKMKNKYLKISVATFVSLAVIFAFTDLAISQGYADPQSGWANFLELYGQLPGAFMGFLGGSTLLASYKAEKDFKSIISVIGVFILTLFTSLMFWGDVFGAQALLEETNPIPPLGLGLLMLILTQVFLRRIPANQLGEYKAAAKVALTLIFVAGLLSVWSIKIPWGRWTYRDMLEIGDLSLFSPWYLPQGNNGHHSFISGHTALSFCVLPVVLLFKKNKRQFTIAWVLALTWGVIGAISRVKIGAHFPSDVLFGGGQTLLWFWVLRNKYNKK